MKTFDKPAQTEINAVITPGAFCDSIKTTEAPKPLPISAGLLSANWYDFVKTGTPSLRDKYIACKADLEKKDFNATRCGAEITGFMAGLSSTSGLQKREESKGTCKKEIDRLYESLNMTDRLCLMPNTDPKLVAKIFLSRIESLEMERENTNVSGFGAVGYQSIYYGLLCRAQ